MRLLSRISLAFMALLAIYTVWPLVDVYRLARAIQTRDVAALERQVEFGAVQTSVTRQVLRTYLALSGQQERIPAVFREATVSAAAAAMQPALAQLVTPERMLEFFAEGWPGADRGKTGSPTPMKPDEVDLFSGSLRQAWNLYWASEYRFRNYSVGVPPDAEPRRRIGLNLYLIQWRWKLYSIDLPEEVRVRAAQELIRAAAGR